MMDALHQKQNYSEQVEEQLVLLQIYRDKQMEICNGSSSVNNENGGASSTLTSIIKNVTVSTCEKKNDSANPSKNIITLEKKEHHRGSRTHMMNEKLQNEERRKQQVLSHLRILLGRHKRLVEKDILERRALVEKKLNIDIQRELGMELATITKIKSLQMDGINVDVDGVKGNSDAQVDTLGCRENSKRPRKGSQGKGNKSRSVSSTLSENHLTKKKLYCLCNTPYDKKKFYVRCDLCANWFHGECVGINENMSQSMSEFACTDCQTDETQQIYCLCKQPYDETKFYIYCDKCEDWFHGRCVGILQSEADTLDEYLCPNCEQNSSINSANMKNLNNNDFDLLKKLMEQIMAYKSAWPFMEPVDPKEAPNYYQIIKQPMDLRTIESRVQGKKYKTLNQFISDMTKIFENCRYYNPEDSQTPFFQCAQSLEAYFVLKIKNIREKLSEEKLGFF